MLKKTYIDQDNFIAPDIYIMAYDSNGTPAGNESLEDSLIKKYPGIVDARKDYLDISRATGVDPAGTILVTNLPDNRYHVACFTMDAQPTTGFSPDMFNASMVALADCLETFPAFLSVGFPYHFACGKRASIWNLVFDRIFSLSNELPNQILMLAESSELKNLKECNDNDEPKTISIMAELKSPIINKISVGPSPKDVDEYIKTGCAEIQHTNDILGKAVVLNSPDGHLSATLLTCHDANLKTEKDYAELKKCLDSLADMLQNINPSIVIGFPENFGCQAGGDWSRIKRMIQDFSKNVLQDVVIVNRSE